MQDLFTEVLREKGAEYLMPEATSVEKKRKIVFDTVSDLVTDFLYYHRKEDEDLGLGEIEKLIADGHLDKREIIDHFAREFESGLLDADLADLEDDEEEDLDDEEDEEDDDLNEDDTDENLDD